jgi:transcription antitermination factor NusG
MAEPYSMDAVQPIRFERAANSGAELELSSWYAVQTFPRREKKVEAELRRKGIETFLPLVSEKHQWSDRRHVIDLPLFPAYVFVRIMPRVENRVAVLRAAGVTGFVGVRGIGTAIPDTEIASVQGVVDNKVPFHLSESFGVGQRVRVRGGSLDGVEGVLVAVKGERSLLISIELINRSLCVSIEGYHVEPA